MKKPSRSRRAVLVLVILWIIAAHATVAVAACWLFGWITPGPSPEEVRLEGEKVVAELREYKLVHGHYPPNVVSGELVLAPRERDYSKGCQPSAQLNHGVGVCYEALEDGPRPQKYMLKVGHPNADWWYWGDLYGDGGGGWELILRSGG